MAFTLGNLIGFETGGLEEATSTTNAPDIQTSVVNTGTYALHFDNVSLDQYEFNPFEGGASDAGDRQAIGFAFRTDDLTVSANYLLILALAGNVNQMALAIDSVTAELVLLDQSLSEVGRSSAGVAVDSWMYIEVYWQNLDSGAAEVFLDGVQVITVTARDFFNAPGSPEEVFDEYQLSATTANAHNIYFDDIYTASGLTATSELLGPSEVIPYRSSLNSVTPDVGPDLDIGTWLAIQTIPFDAAIGAEYTDAAAGSVNCDDVGGSAGTGGPVTDADAQDDINGVKAICRMERSGGGASNHFILLGNSGDGTTRSADLGAGNSAANFFFVSELATIVPLSSEILRIGIETTGARDFECYDMLAQILHTPSAVSNDITATSTEAFGQTADIQAVGEMSAASSLAYAAVADIDAPGPLTATSPEAFAAAGAALTAAGELRATSPLDFAKLNADLRAIGLLSATSVEDFSAVPVINAPGNMAATSTLAYAAANATLNALGELSITATLVYAANADINAPGAMAATSVALFDDAGADLTSAATNDMTATSPQTFGQNADINAVGEMAASASEAFAAVANINAPGSIAATSVLAYAATAVLNAPGEMTITATLVYAANADIGATPDISANSSMLYGATANINAVGELTITATLVFADAGADLQGPSSEDMTATSPETFGEAPTLNAVGEMAATSTEAYAAVAVLNALGQLAATSALAYGQTADIDAPGPLAATSNVSFAQLTATLDAIAEMAATSALGFAAAGANLTAIGELSAISGLTYGQTAAALAALGELTATSPALFAEMADLTDAGAAVRSVFAIILEAALFSQVLEADLFSNSLDS